MNHSNTFNVSSKQILQIPTDAEVFETPMSFHWMQDGILYCITKAEDWSFEKCDAILALYRRIGGYEKINILVDASNTKAMSEDIQTYYTNRLPAYTKACAILTPLSAVQNLSGPFLKLSFNGFATRMFNNESDARAWLEALKNK